MKSWIYRLMCLGVVGQLLSCSNENYREQVANPDWLHRSVQQLTDVIVHDIFSPPVASRIYAYSSIAAYEVVALSNPEYRSLAGQLNELQPINVNIPSQYYMPLAAVHAYLTVGKKLVFSEDRIEAFQQRLYKEIEEIGMPKQVYKNSLAVGQAVAEHIIAWADKDHYKETRSAPKFTVTTAAGRWRPTPPAYMDAVEPHWNQIRPFLLQRADQFAPPPPPAFSTDTASLFYKEAYEVYRISKQLTEEQKEIANFWDCNPYKVDLNGHVMYATKKITPGGHWIGIASIASRTAKDSFEKAAETYAWVAIGLADAFISCWDEKYRSVLLRPETYINEYIDKSWVPLLQTPPFPEYTSGHSVVSGAAGEILTHLYGDTFFYTDTTEVRYGLPARSYNSFRQASSEASISRVYGGIHYTPAVRNGLEQGKQIGAYIIAHLQTRSRKRQ
ncbi:MAG: vanadium-dependent haloperoxidase [Cytophagales bacterium]|nr:vanadium-dependent haloperoxidase [Bernardetiaceae bacterium]MDW8210703.1 vanadium-dependent haloperoxidase [Cytophagales bacterium]